ncbi:hypothetical protein GCM10010521_38440 [Streptomyces rameus]|uniref:Uncharacterized protein n=1 Tax=Streptomyces rameus TaxID=68261 RepID=A0ABP6NG97_9ACTN
MPTAQQPDHRADTEQRGAHGRLTDHFRHLSRHFPGPHPLRNPDPLVDPDPLGNPDPHVDPDPLVDSDPHVDPDPLVDSARSNLTRP